MLWVKNILLHLSQLLWRQKALYKSVLTVNPRGILQKICRRIWFRMSVLQRVCNIQHIQRQCKIIQMGQSMHKASSHTQTSTIKTFPFAFLPIDACTGFSKCLLKHCSCMDDTSSGTLTNRQVFVNQRALQGLFLNSFAYASTETSVSFLCTMKTAYKIWL